MVRLWCASAPMPTVYQCCALVQLLAQNDCLLKNRENAEWVAFGDFDEYFVYLQPQPATFKGLLCKKRLEGAAAVNYGNYELPRQCNETDLWDAAHDKFGVEYVTLRAEKATCNKANKDEIDPDICRGRRKFFGNPRRVRKTQGIVVCQTPTDEEAMHPLKGGQILRSVYSSKHCFPTPMLPLSCALFPIPCVLLQLEQVNVHFPRILVDKRKKQVTLNVSSTAYYNHYRGLVSYQPW